MDEVIRLINNAFAYFFKEARLGTKRGADVEHNKYVRLISTILRAFTSKDGDLLSHFDNINENETAADSNNTSLKHFIIDNHTVAANRGKITDQLPLEHIFGSCKTFRKIIKNLGFHLTFRVFVLQRIISTTLANDIYVILISFYLIVPILIPITQTQVMFNESIQNNYTNTYDSWYTERKLSTNGNEIQVDIGCAQHVISPKNLITTFQTEHRIGVPKRNRNIAIFDPVKLGKYFCELDG